MDDKPSNFDIIAELVKETSGQGNIISLPRIYLKITGDVVVGLFLSQCVWYSDKGGSGDGWFYKSNKEWQEEIGLSYAQIKRATAKLEGMGILYTKLKKAKGAPTTHYCVDIDRLTKLIFDFLEIRQNGGVENQESLKSDFEESQQSITALTQSSTDTALTEGPAEKTPTARDYLTDVFVHSKKPDQAGIADPSQDVEAWMQTADEFVNIYHQRTGLWPDTNVQKPAIKELTQDSADLELWDQVVTAWVKIGWSKRNVDGMIDCYLRGEIPTTKPNGGKHGPNRPVRQGDGSDKYANLTPEQRANLGV
jgi:hypothetical protein